MNRSGIKQARGFTLIEILVVIVIVAILASVAIPNYLEYVKRSRRSEAMAAVQAVITGLEKYFLSNNAYTNDFTQISINGVGLRASGSSMYTESGNYSVAISQVDGIFTVQATVVSGAPQEHDDECNSFSMNVAGQRSASNSSGSDSTSTCWKQ